MINVKRPCRHWLWCRIWMRNFWNWDRPSSHFNRLVAEELVFSIGRSIVRNLRIIASACSRAFVMTLADSWWYVRWSSSIIFRPRRNSVKNSTSLTSSLIASSPWLKSWITFNISLHTRINSITEDANWMAVTGSISDCFGDWLSSRIAPWRAPFYLWGLRSIEPRAVAPGWIGFRFSGFCLRNSVVEVIRMPAARLNIKPSNSSRHMGERARVIGACNLCGWSSRLIICCVWTAPPPFRVAHESHPIPNPIYRPSCRYLRPKTGGRALQLWCLTASEVLKVVKPKLSATNALSVKQQLNDFWIMVFGNLLVCLWSSKGLLKPDYRPKVRLISTLKRSSKSLAATQ